MRKHRGSRRTYEPGTRTRSWAQYAEWERGHQRPSPVGFYGPHDYLERHGRVFVSESLTGAETAYLKNALAQHRRERFENSLRLARRTPGLNYVVGVARVSTVLVPHAWVSLNGKVVDLTCLKTCNPYRSHQLDVTERGGPVRRNPRQAHESPDDSGSSASSSRTLCL